MHDFIKSMNWRYATKKFDSSKDISSQDLEVILEAIQLSSSSFGLQPYQIYIVKNAELREKLLPASWGQSQITDASHLIVFANKTNFGDELTDNYIDTVCKTRDLPHEAIKGYADFMKSKLGMLSEEEKMNWTTKQVYIALSNAINATAVLKIDSCPMEGFEPKVYNELLGLADKNLNASVVLAIGYRSNEDETQHFKKVRKSKSELFIHL